MDETICKRLSDLREIFKSKLKLAEDDFFVYISLFYLNMQQLIRIYLKEIFDSQSELKGVPVNVRNEFAPHMSLIELKKDQVLIWPQDIHPNIYFLFRGKLKKSQYPPEESDKEIEEKEHLDMILYNRLFQVMSPLNIFGSMSILQFSNQKNDAYSKWQSTYVYALEDCYLFQLQFTAISNIIKKIFSGNYLITEGQKIDRLYLVREGECKVFSRQMPIISRNITKMSRSPRKMYLKDILQNKSYFSQTTSTFQLGIIQENDWIGDEVFIFDENPVPYSVIATKPLRVLTISKDDFFAKMSKDILQMFEQNGRSKYKWFEKRFTEIICNVNKMQDNYFEGITEKAKEISRKYPQAQSHALNNIRNKELVEFNQESKYQSNNQEDQKNQHKIVSQFPNMTAVDVIALQSIIGGNLQLGLQQIPGKTDLLPNQNQILRNTSTLSSQVLSKKSQFQKTLELDANSTQNSVQLRFVQSRASLDSSQQSLHLPIAQKHAQSQVVFTEAMSPKTPMTQNFIFPIPQHQK